jgi:hypothetical protein
VSGEAPKVVQLVRGDAIKGDIICKKGKVLLLYNL